MFKREKSLEFSLFFNDMYVIMYVYHKSICDQLLTLSTFQAQPADDSSGGEEWELMDICYEREIHNADEWAREKIHLIFNYTQEYMAATTYGKVVEKDRLSAIKNTENVKHDGF